MIRSGVAPDIYPPRKIEVKGVIDTVSRWLAKKKVNYADARLEIMRSASTIRLVMNETSTETFGTVTGQMILDEDYQAFSINRQKKFTLLELSNFIKMHRYCFEEQRVAMNLVADLRNFKGKVNKEMEKVQDTRGNSRVMVDQVVESNIPPAFTLQMPIYKGGIPVRFEVSVGIIIRDAEMECYLESLEANELEKKIIDSVFAEQLEMIETLAPELVQVEM